MKQVTMAPTTSTLFMVVTTPPMIVKYMFTTTMMAIQASLVTLLTAMATLV